MLKRILWILFAALAIIIGLYPGVYFIFDRKFGLLASKDDALLNNIFWNTAFYIHIVFGGIALLVGWVQFSNKLRAKNLSLHRTIGKVYVMGVLLSSIAGIYVALFATGGIITSLGFLSLGVIWFWTTLTAYFSIRKGKLKQHENSMIYSYAACFAAVTLRVWLPLLVMIFKDFITAYTIVAWLCWVPNLVVATLIVRERSFPNISSAV